MRRVFVDTNYLGAVANPRDRLHASAMKLAGEFGADASVRYVTTLGVLAEFLTLFSQDPHLRARAVDFVDRLRVSNVEIIHDDEQLFDAGLTLYRSRPDKTYSMIDCMSMAICRRLRIAEILTGDHDFEREGSMILM